MKFKYKGKNFNIEVKECKGVFSKSRGLMFKEKSKPLLFVFKTAKKRPVHSFFCKPFVAIWLIGDRVIDVKFVNPWKPYIKPKEKFDKLLEIPSNNRNFKYFIDDIRKL